MLAASPVLDGNGVGPARAADRIGSRRMLITATLAIIAFGFSFEPLFSDHSTFKVLTFLCLGLALMGLTYGPIGSFLAGLFPTAIRYTGTSLTFNLAGILGASLAPYIATSLATQHGFATSATTSPPSAASLWGRCWPFGTTRAPERMRTRR